MAIAHIVLLSIILILMLVRVGITISDHQEKQRMRKSVLDQLSEANRDQYEGQ